MSVWTLRATGSRRAVDLDEVRRALSVLADPQMGIQLQAAPYWSFRTFAGTDLEGASAWVKDHDDATGVYYAVNPVAPNLAVRAKNEHALCRRWLFVDCDRPKSDADDKLSATDAEHEQARSLARRVMDHLAGLGWPVPILIDSGNGFHLLYRVDLPNDRLAKALIRDVLHNLDKFFSGTDGKIGKEAHDARRLAKLPGTMARRGPAQPDRPHRMCHLVHCPNECVIVTADQLREAGQIEKKSPEPAANGQAFKLTTPPGDDGRAYAKAALRYEVARVALESAGQRNNTLFKAGANMGELVGGGCILRQEVEAELEFAALKAGLEEREVRATIRSALDTGAKNPRKPPERSDKKPQRNSVPIAASCDPDDPLAKFDRIVVCGLDVERKTVEWLWPNRVPKRFITVFAGRTGLGKSFVTCDMAARITNGADIPFGCGECFERGDVLFISEDPHDFMLAPRLYELRANMSRVHFLKWEVMIHYSLENTKFLERAFEEANHPKLIAIDPPTNFLGERDEHKNTEVRQTLMHLVTWLAERDVAAVLITHVNKQTGKGIEALNRVMGSVAWTTTSRIAHSFAPDPDDKERCLFVPMKNNLGPLARGLSYRIAKTDHLARIEWLGEVDTTADEAMSGDKRPPRQVLATDWLIGLFKQKREWPSDDFWASARQHGISKNAINEARVKLEMPKPRVVTSLDGDKTWVWWVPEDWPPFNELAV